MDVLFLTTVGRKTGKECWKRVVQAQPRYANYQEKTDRQLPVIRLVPASAQP